MKVIAFNGSPHTSGVIQSALEFMAEELESQGIETEIIQIGKENIRGCIACEKCRELGRCVYDDDPVNKSAEKIKNASGIIIGSPVYYGSIAGNCKCFLDRLFFPGIDLKYKAAAALVSCRRSGGINAFHQMNNYFNLAKAFISPSVYWGVIHGNNRDELLQDLEGIHVVRDMVQNMAWLVKALELAKKEIPLPIERDRPWTNFVRQE